MEEKLHDIRQTFQKFKAAYATNSFDTCSNLLSQLKVKLTELPGLPPLFKPSATAVQELLLASKNNIVFVYLMFWDMH
jgi:26S proteasome regulatory subunit N12